LKAVDKEGSSKVEQLKAIHFYKNQEIGYLKKSPERTYEFS